MADQKTPEMTKEAEAVARHRAFEVGIAHLCKKAGVTYAGLAKAAGQTPDSLSKALLAEIQAALAKE